MHEAVKSLAAPPACERDSLLYKGLFQTQRKFIPSFYFYDAEGSRIFEKITQAPEYYLTQKELLVLEQNAARLRPLLSWGRPLRVIELGAGSGAKALRILRELSGYGPLEYIAIDISADALQQTLSDVQAARLPIETRGLVGDNLQLLDSLSNDAGCQSIVLFLGSSLGNYPAQEARRFLQSISRSLSPGDFMLIGFDLMKDISVMQRAYSDAAGWTREFNLNLLRRMNRELGANFNESCFEHHAFFNPVNRCMESYLIAKSHQTVSIKSWQRMLLLDESEAIHTEISQKYVLADIDRFADGAACSVAELWTDAERWFCDALFQVQ